VNRLVAGAGDRGTDDHDGGRLQHEVGPERRSPGRNRPASSSEDAERSRQRHGREHAERVALELEPAPRAEEKRLDRADGDA